jgi:G3E family GTPase
MHEPAPRRKAQSEMETKLVPIYVLSGFLGSGKTTFLNRMLGCAEFFSTAVIVNEFGEIGLDHLIIGQSNDNVVLLESGCLCCTIVDSLHETLAHLNFQKVRGEIPPFERIVIETSGLAEPAPVLSTLLGHPLVTAYYRLERLVVTADAQNAATGVDVHPEIARQIALADAVIVTKLDLVDDNGTIGSIIDSLNPTAERFDARDLKAAMTAFRPRTDRVDVVRPMQFRREHGDARKRRHSEIRSFSLVLERATSWAGIAAWWQLVRDTFGDRLLRCKGILEVADSGEVVFIQGVQRVFHKPERLGGWPDDDHRSRIVCITLGVDEAELRATLAAFAVEAGSNPSLTLKNLTVEGIPE